MSYTYTVDGKLSTVTDSTGTTSFTYNSMDGLTRVDYPDGNYVSYRYDKFNRLTKVSTAFGDTAYQYDLLDRITRVVDRNGYATVYEYDANGNRTAVKYANGLTVSYEYDKLNRLICEETIDNDSNIVVKYVYTLGASGERLSVTELDRTVEYTYDELYRLTSETITKGKTKTTYAYEYDNVSNRTLKTVNGVETVYTYNELNQLVSEDSTIYEYDNAGNLVRVVGVGKTAIYSYNSENKLIKATVQQGNNVVVETYTYDYAGNRTSKTTTINNHVEKVYYLNDNSSLTNVLVELNVDGEAKVYYTIGADLVSQEINGKVYVYLYDGHGTVRALANENGKITDTYTYDAFGNLLNSTGTTANSYRYCGEQFDSTTGLYYLRARYMNPSVGRFISMDTYQGYNADPISLHKYLYANSNPVTYTDPSGYMSLGELGVSGAISNILDTIGNNFAMAIWSSFIGGFLAVGDQISAGNFNPKDLLTAFGKGFIFGFAFSLVAMFVPIKIMMALSGLSIIGGFAGAVDSFASGEFWQGIYRASISALFSVGWWTNYGNLFNIKASAYKDIPWYEQPRNTQSSGRAKNNLKPNPKAKGDHVSYKVDPDTGEIINYKVYRKNPQNPSGFDEVIGYDGVGSGHTNSVTGEKVPTPHVHDKNAPGKIRPPYSNEIPPKK